jgi:hypothetical protein
LRPAGAVQLGLRREERDPLRAAIGAGACSRRNRLLDPGTIELEVDFHGRRDGPLRDPVMRILRIDQEHGEPPAVFADLIDRIKTLAA